MLSSLVLLCVFAFLAGFIDAMVGGGGLIQLPAFFILQPQLSLAQALATNKFASFSGTATAAVSYLKHVSLDKRVLIPAAVTACLGAFSGAMMVSYFDKNSFTPFIIVVLICLLLYTLWKKDFGVIQKDIIPIKRAFIFALLTGLFIGFYDGVIGPGTGSFLMFIFVSAFHYNFLLASAATKVVNTITNAAALVFFILHGFVVWKIALPVAVCNVAGNFAGTKLALKKGSGFVRIFFILIVSVLICKLAWDYYHTKF